MQPNSALLFCLILLPFFGCRKAESYKINEINVGVIGIKNDTTYTRTFKEFYKIDLNTNKLLIIKNPSLDNPKQKQEILETTFNFSTNRITGSFIEYANKTKSVRVLDYSLRPVCCDLPLAKPNFFEFRQGEYSKLYIKDFDALTPELRQLYFLLVKVSHESNTIVKFDSSKINVDSLFESKSQKFKIIFKPPPPPPQPTIKYKAPK